MSTVPLKSASIRALRESYSVHRLLYWQAVVRLAVPCLMVLCLIVARDFIAAPNESVADQFYRNVQAFYNFSAFALAGWMVFFWRQVAFHFKGMFAIYSALKDKGENL